MNKTLKEKLHKLCRYTSDILKAKTGKGPKDIKSHIVCNKLFIEILNYLTPIEKEIASTKDGITTVKMARERLTEKINDEYITNVSKIMGCEISRGCILWEITHDEAYIVLTTSDEL